MEDFDEFYKRCEDLIKLRGLTDDIRIPSTPIFPERYQLFISYKALKFSGYYQEHNEEIIDASDCVLLAYDAFLGAKGSWNELCLRSILYHRENIKTGLLAGAWFGAYNGFKDIPEINYLGNFIYSEKKKQNIPAQIQLIKQMMKLGSDLFHKYDPSNISDIMNFYPEQDE